MALPPLFAGAVHDTSIPPVLSAVAVTPVGASGTVRGVSEVVAVEYGLSPAMFFAATWKVYAVPLARPVTVADVPVPGPSLNVVQVPPVHDCTM